MNFPKICTRAPFGPSAHLKQIAEYFPANNSNSDDKRSRQRQPSCSSSTEQNPRRICNAQPSYGKPLGVSRTRSNQPTFTTPPATWRWSEASRSRGAALYELLLGQKPSFISEAPVHTAHNTKQKQHSTTHKQAASQQPTQLQHD